MLSSKQGSSNKHHPLHLQIHPLLVVGRVPKRFSLLEPKKGFPQTVGPAWGCIFLALPMEEEAPACPQQMRSSCEKVWPGLWALGLGLCKPSAGIQDVWGLPGMERDWEQVAVSHQSDGSPLRRCWPGKGEWLKQRQKASGSCGLRAKDLVNAALF